MKIVFKGLLIVLVMSSSLYSSIRDNEVRRAENIILKKNIPNCIGVSTFYDKVYCAGKVYAVLDDVLNYEYKSLKKRLSKNQKKRLKKVQTAWIRDRDDKCASANNRRIVVDLTCAKRETLESIIYLRNINNNPKEFERLLMEYKERR